MTVFVVFVETILDNGQRSRPAVDTVSRAAGRRRVIEARRLAAGPTDVSRPECSDATVHDVAPFHLIKKGGVNEHRPLGQIIGYKVKDTL